MCRTADYLACLLNSEFVAFSIETLPNKIADVASHPDACRSTIAARLGTGPAYNMYGLET